MIAHLEAELNATVHHVTVRKVDLVQDTTSVEVRYQLHAAPALDGSHEALAGAAEFGR